MKLKICKLGEEITLALPDELVARLGWSPSDVLEGEIIDGVLKDW